MTRLYSDCRHIVILLALLALISISSLAEAGTWSFAVLGDQRGMPSSSTGVNDLVVQAMVNDIVQNRGVSLVLVGGDQIHGIFPDQTPPPPPPDLPTMYKNWRADMGSLLNISYPVRGNHETEGETSTPYYPYYWDTCIAQVLTQIPQNGPSGEQGMTYSFSNENAFFVGVDEFMPDNSDRVNQPWVTNQLSANILPHVFVYGHLPAVPVLPSSQEQSLATWPPNRDVFWQSIAAGGGMLYFCGHSHLYNRATISLTNSSGTTTLSQLTVGNGGAPLDTWGGQYYPYPQPNTTITCTCNSHLEGSWGYDVVTVADNTVTIVHYYNTNTANPTQGTWLPFDNFSYTLTMRSLGVNNVSQNLTPQILNYYNAIAITKTGSGTLALNAGTSTYSEPITVSGGRLNVYGNYANAPVTVNSGSETALYSGSSINNVTTNGQGLLFGGGTVIGSLTNNGDVSPGFYTGPWNLNVTGSYAQTAAGGLDVEIATTSNYGQIQVTGSPGTANLNGIVNVTLQNDYIPAANQIFPNIITASGGLAGTFVQIANPMITPTLYWQPIYTANSFGLKAVHRAIAPQLELLLLSSLHGYHGRLW
jgi:autotransporter-associated beta strand protein